MFILYNTNREVPIQLKTLIQWVPRYLTVKSLITGYAGVSIASHNAQVVHGNFTVNKKHKKNSTILIKIYSGASAVFSCSVVPFSLCILLYILHKDE